MKSLSLVVPVFNAPDLARAACARLPELASAAAACGFGLVEAVFVDDGSEPPLRGVGPVSGLPDVAVRVLRNGTNRVKGFSVKRGALAARGDWVLMSDVDLSAPFPEFRRLAERSDAWMVCGSRRGRPGMPFRRRLLSRMVHALVRLAGVKGVQDTQCGFKLFRMDAMRAVFAAQRTDRFAFDVELLRRVFRAGGTVAEVPVDWRGGSRRSLRVLRDAPRKLYDLFRIR